MLSVAARSIGFSVCLRLCAPFFISFPSTADGIELDPLESRSIEMEPTVGQWSEIDNEKLQPRCEVSNHNIEAIVVFIVFSYFPLSNSTDFLLDRYPLFSAMYRNGEDVAERDEKGTVCFGKRGVYIQSLYEQ